MVITTTHVWNSVGISPSGSTIITCCKNTNNDYYDIYSCTNNTNQFTLSSTTTDIPVNNISVIDISYVLLCTRKQLYISQDNGKNFTPITTLGIGSSTFWTGVSISSNTGKYMVACIGGNPGGGIYLSSDFGKNWVNSLSVNQNFTSISISETGKYIVACFSEGGGGIYTSSDTGNSWSNNQTIPINLNWSSICIKEKYSFAVVCDTSGYIYTSTSNGNIWVDALLNLPITTNFKKVCISDYGYAVALSNYGMLVTANYGENWTTKSIYNNISTVTDIGVSTKGLLVACDISYIYTSTIYSVYNNSKIYYSSDVSFVTKGLLDNQVNISDIFNNNLKVNFQNPFILPDSYNIIVQNVKDSTDPLRNIPIQLISNSNNYKYSTPVTDLKDNMLYKIDLQTIYPNGVISTISKQVYTKGPPIGVSVDINSITDICMNISFINCPNPPISYTINIVNQSLSADYRQLTISEDSVISYLNTNNAQKYPYTISNLSPDAKYQLSITSNYIDVSYTSIPITDISTKSAPSNISYTLPTGSTVEVTYNPPSYTRPDSITLILFDVIENVIQNTNTIQNSGATASKTYIFEDLKINKTYNIILESNYGNGIVIKSSPITFITNGTPIVISSYRFDNNLEIQKYIITTNIYLVSKPTYLINFQYPKEYELKYGISHETFDLPINSSNFNLYNVDVLGEYNITVSAIFDAENTITSDPFNLIIKKHPIIQFGNIDISYSYINIPYTIYEYGYPPPKYTLYLKNTLYPLIYDQSSNITNILTEVTYSDTKRFSIFTGTGNYSIYISDGIFYSDYINITVPEIVTVAIDYSKTDNSTGNKLTVHYNVLTPIPDSSYTLFVNGNVSYPTISFSSSTVDASVKELSVNVTIIGTMRYYIIHYFPNGGIYRTPSGIQNFESKTSIIFGKIDISYNYFVIPTYITTFELNTRYIINIYETLFKKKDLFTNTLLISPSTSSSITNARFNVYANTGTYYINLTDGNKDYAPDPPFITLQTASTTLSEISYEFNSSTSTDNINSNKLSVSYYILNTYAPKYTLYLQNENDKDLSFSIVSDISFTPISFVPTTKLIMEINTITRSGNYSFYIKHDYTGVINNSISPITYISPSSELIIDISNTVNLSYISNTSTNKIIIKPTITSFDMNPLTYKLYLQSVSFTSDLSYSYNITIPISTDYTIQNKYIESIDFSNIYVNTGNYIYYVIDSSGRKYSNNNYGLTLPSQSNTFNYIGDLSVNSFSSYNSKNNGSISTLYGISYESYKPTYTIVATNTTIPGVTDCSYSASVYIDNSSTIINRVKDISYSITVSNIYRTGIYRVYLQNNYNGSTIRSNNYKEITSTKNIYVYLPNDVNYGTLMYDISSITIPFTITSYDISDVLYNVVINNKSISSAINDSQSITLANNYKYYAANISNNTIYFRNLFVNTGDYSYNIYNNNGFIYSGGTVTLPPVLTTFYLKDPSSTIYSTYNANNNGSITVKYDISYLTYNSTYKVVAIHNDLTDCSFTNSMAGVQIYSAIKNSYSLSIPNIFRTGIYTIYLQNIYNNSTNIETTISKEISVDLPNNVTYTNVVCDCSSITLPITVTSHDISFVSYTIYLKNSAVENDISYNQTFIVLNNNRNYSNPTIYESTFLFNDLYANSGTYNYYVVGSKTYTGSNITIPNVTTITLRDLSSTMFTFYSPTNVGSIIARYDISYISYQPKYQLNLSHRTLPNDINYNTTVTSNNIPSQNSNITNSYDISFSNIYRTGIYSVYIQNKYTNTGSNYIDKTNTIDISVNLPNDISYTSVTRDISSINIDIRNICFDISNAYIVTVINNSITTDISYSNQFTVDDNREYTAPITTTNSFKFPNLFVNTGNYYYFVTDRYGNRYPSINTDSNKISLPTTNTLTIRDVSSTIFNTYANTNNGSITLTYDISYISYKPTHTFQVVSDILTDCSFLVSRTEVSIPSDYSNIQNSYTFTISDIYRTSIYSVYLKNSYNNGLGYEQYMRNVLVNLPNYVNYQTVTANTTSIAIKFEITSYDISATNYTLYIKNASLDLSKNEMFTIPYSNKYSEKNTLSVQDFSFQNLFANSGTYYYYFTNSNGINYPSNIYLNSISLTALDNTVRLMGLSSTMYAVYSVTNIGSITGEYQIIVKSNNPTYTLIATNKVLNDCSYSVAITGANIPSNINISNYLSISSIYRTGIYSVLLQNKYTGGIIPEYSQSIDISVNLPNDVSFQTVTSTVNTISIPYKITSFDISNVTYTVYVKNTVFDLSKNASYILINSTNYNLATTYNDGNFILTGLLANTGNYYYYIINSNGVRYPTTDSISNRISLVPVTNTITLNSVSPIGVGITANYSILYLTHIPTYKVIATNIGTIVTDCCYNTTKTSPNLPTTPGSYSIFISSIKRSGNYRVSMQNIYNGGSIETALATKNILVNIPNVVTTSGVVADFSSITIPVTITSYDISNVTYTIWVKDVSLNTLTANYTYILNNATTDYTQPTSLTNRSFTLTGLLANTGNYYYYITNNNGMSYPDINNQQNTVSLPFITNTIALNSVSSTNLGGVSGVITANYNISYLTYNPTYKLIAINTSISTVTDCSYISSITSTSIPSTYQAISNPYMNLSISNIKRSGIYKVIMQNTYNTSGNIETAVNTVYTSINILNEVTSSGVTSDISSITIPVTITSYDISNVIYTVTIRDISFSELQNSQYYTLNNNTDYTQANKLINRNFIFPNLLANTGKYNYSITSDNGFSSSINTISLQPVSNTIVLNSVSSTKTDVNGSITANYSISYLTHIPTYKVIATNIGTIVTDCCYNTTITSPNLPTTYGDIVGSYNLSISNIKRSGNYKVIMQNTYNNNGNVETAADTRYTSINITNDVSYGIGITSDISYIAIPFTITSYDISNVEYTMWVKDVSFTDVSYSQTYTLNNTNTYNLANTLNETFILPNLLANTGKYNYYITSTNGLSYTQKTVSLPPVTNTIALNSLSAANSDVSGSITANYSFSYLTYKPTYKVIATNNTIGTSDCSYAVTVSNVPTTYATIASSYNVSISNIRRSGNYSVVLQNTYNNGGNVETASAIENILVNIPNKVTYGTVTSDISYINIPFTITSYDISSVKYTVTVQDISFTDLSYNQEYTINNSNLYNAANIYNGSFTLYNLLANTGKYNYYVTNTNGVTYPTSTITLKSAANTIALNSVSAANSDVSGSITANYSFSYLTYNPNYKIIAKNNTVSGVNDCSYMSIVTSIPTYATIANIYSLSISNIKRSGNYQVILQNIYNNGGSIETATKNTLVNIPNKVDYGMITSDISSITVPFTITSYDISSVTYTVRIKDVSFTNLTYVSSNFTVTNSTDYTTANIFEGSYTFTNLFVNTGKYYYYITNTTNGLRYPAIDDVLNTISLTPVARTITLKEVSSNILTIYSSKNSGRITAKYDISYISYAPKYKITAQHTHSSASDCSYTNSTTNPGLPPYSIDISNIYRSGLYSVYLQNISGSIEQTNSLDISVNLPNDVSFIKVTDTSYSIDISFQITTYDISLVNYDLCIQNATNPDVSYSITYPIYPTRDYTKPTITNIYHSVFTGLTVSGNYNYYMIDGSNNKTYTGSRVFIIGDYVPVTFSLTGGVKSATNSPNNNVNYIFDSGGTFTVTVPPKNPGCTIRIFLVGGGGGGGSGSCTSTSYTTAIINGVIGTRIYSEAINGGGGGAGQVLETQIDISSTTTFTITIGNGGANDTNGTDTIISYNSTSIIAYGGGKGSNGSNPAELGGGGCSGRTTLTFYSGSTNTNTGYTGGGGWYFPTIRAGSGAGAAGDGITVEPVNKSVDAAHDDGGDGVTPSGYFVTNPHTFITHPVFTNIKLITSIGGAYGIGGPTRSYNQYTTDFPRGNFTFWRSATKFNVNYLAGNQPPMIPSTINVNSENVMGTAINNTGHGGIGGSFYVRGNGTDNGTAYVIHGGAGGSGKCIISIL